MNPPYHIRKRTIKGRTAYDLDYSYKGRRWRCLIGHSDEFTPEEIQEEAIRLVKAIQNPARQRQQPLADPSKAYTLADLKKPYWQEFDLKNRVDHKRPRHIIEDHLIRIFGKTLLSELTYGHGIDYQAQRKAEGASLGTIQREWGVLMRLLNIAVNLRWVTFNPFTACPKPKGLQRQRVASVDELLTIQEHAGGELWRLILVALNTGLRLGNLFKLEFSWIAENGLWMMIPAPKSCLKNHPAKLPLNALCVESLTQKPSVSGRVWSWASIHSIEKAWRVTLRKAGVQDLHLHDLRHTFATRLQGLGVGYEVRQLLLGHKMPGMTQYYSHGGPAWEEQLRKAVDLLDVDWRKCGLVNESVNVLDKGKAVVHLNEYKSLKKLVSRPRLERGTHALKGQGLSRKTNDLDNTE